MPRGFWAELECAFLNTYQARWQYAADSLGHGFAQGKTMLVRRRDLAQAGGIQALAEEIAEDAAATKLVRRRACAPASSMRPSASRWVSARRGRCGTGRRAGRACAA